MASVVKINAITVPAERADELAARFAARAGQVSKADGFEEFQLLRPTDDRTTWLVYTRWRDEDAFNAWMQSPAFAAGHSQASGAGSSASSMPGTGGAPPHGQRPVATAAEVWSFDVEQREVAPT